MNLRFGIILSCSIVLLITSLVPGQTVTGSVVNQIEEGLAFLEVQLFVGTDTYSTSTDVEGYFQIDNITNIVEDVLPIGFSISQNYPNPFNPKTRFNIAVPMTSLIRIEVFDITGQRVMDVLEKTISAGNSHIDLELQGLPNGFYIARIIINDKYSIVKKLMLLYGSEHLSNTDVSTEFQLPKTMSIILDSLVVSGTYIGRKVFNDIPIMEGSSIDLGDLLIDFSCPGIPKVTYEAKTYNTVQIGVQCWLKENLDVGTMINSNSDSDNQTNNGTIEKYCHDNNESNCDTYGGLYQWNEAMQYVTTEGTQGICPDGWHIPTLTELETLEDYVNHEPAKLVAVGQPATNYTPTNETGFSALFAGYRNYNDGDLIYMGNSAYFWSSTELSNSIAPSEHLEYTGVYLNYSFYNKNSGFSVRCLKY